MPSTAVAAGAAIVLLASYALLDPLNASVGSGAAASSGPAQAVEEAPRDEAALRSLRERLSREAGFTIPTFNDLEEVLLAAPPKASEITDAQKTRWFQAADRIGFSLADADGKLYVDHNFFTNRTGQKLLVSRAKVDGGEEKVQLSLLFVGVKAEPLRALYSAELRLTYRPMLSSKPGTSDAMRLVDGRSEPFVDTGRVFYSYSLVGKAFLATVTSNYEGSEPVFALSTGPRTIRVNSYSRRVELYLNQGDELRLSASGSVRLGPFVGASGPDGVDGFEHYSVDSGFKLGALLGRVGNRPWSMIGAAGRLVASEDGFVELIVNDNDRGNNSGAYEVTMSLIKPPK